MLILLPEYQDVKLHSGQSFGQAGGNIPRKLPLREHRLRAGVQLEGISESTKLSRRFLEAIEEGSYGELPGGVFSTNYIRQYAQATGYDAELILEHYRAWCGEGTSVEPQQGCKTPAVRWGRFALFG